MMICTSMHCTSHPGTRASVTRVRLAPVPRCVSHLSGVGSPGDWAGSKLSALCWPTPTIQSHVDGYAICTDALCALAVMEIQW